MNQTHQSSVYSLTTVAVELTSVNGSADSFAIIMTPLDIAYVTVTFLMSLMSILGSVVVLFVHWSYVELRTSGRTMLVHLTVADLLTALGNLLGIVWYLNVENLEYKMVFCKFHSALTIMSSIASFIWTVVIAWFVFWILIRMQPTAKQQSISITYILPSISWAIPMVIALTALGLDVLGYDHKLSQASWCWINPETSNATMWMLVTGKAWEFAACILTVVLYAAAKILLFKQVKKRSTLMSRKNTRMDEANTKLTFVPLVFIVIRIWGTIRFLIGSFAHEFANSSAADWIVIMQGTGDSAQGFANFIMYIFFTSKIRERLFKRCHYCNKMCNRQNVSPGHSSSRRQEESSCDPGSETQCRKIQPQLPGKSTDEVQQTRRASFSSRQIDEQNDKVRIIITTATSLLSSYQSDALVRHNLGLSARKEVGVELKEPNKAAESDQSNCIWTSGIS